MKADFDKIKEVEKERIITEISTKWRGRKYPSI